MKKPKLPPTLTRKEFDSDEEFALYQATERSEWEAVSDDIEETRSQWQQSAKHHSIHRLLAVQKRIAF